MPPHPESTPSLRAHAEFESEVVRRIDSPHAASASTRPDASSKNPPECLSSHGVNRSASTGVGASTAGSESALLLDMSSGIARTVGAVAETCGLDPQSVVVAHAEDLLDTIQRLSEDIDIRSAKLNADIALQERRERAFRLWAQQRTEELHAQLDACERQRQQLKAQARRIALSEGQSRTTDW